MDNIDICEMISTYLINTPCIMILLNRTNKTCNDALKKSGNLEKSMNIARAIITYQELRNVYNILNDYIALYSYSQTIPFINQSDDDEDTMVIEHITRFTQLKNKYDNITITEETLDNIIKNIYNIYHDCNNDVKKIFIDKYLNKIIHLDILSNISLYTNYEIVYGNVFDEEDIYYIISCGTKGIYNITIKKLSEMYYELFNYKLYSNYTRMWDIKNDNNHKFNGANNGEIFYLENK